MESTRQQVRPSLHNLGGVYCICYRALWRSVGSSKGGRHPAASFEFPVYVGQLHTCNHTLKGSGEPAFSAAFFFSQSTRRVTGAEAMAPVGSSAWQWYIPAWSRATWVKATVGAGSVCSRRPFQNQVKVELPMSPGPPGSWQLKFSAAPSGTSSPGSATTCTPAGPDAVGVLGLHRRFRGLL